MLSKITDFILYHTPVYYLIQSVWRDEAFSYFLARPSIIKIISNTASDFNPPLYYIFLHLWMQIFGKTDEGLRLLSFLFHVLTVYIVYLFAKRIFSKKFAYFVIVFTFFNPMLIFYSFEMRMYSLFALLALASSYFLYTKNWRLYTISQTLGLYTHSFYPLVFISHVVYFSIFNKINKKSLFKIGKPFLFYLPWLPILLNQFLRSSNSWIYPVDLQLIKSVFGNLFTNYEGTPGGWWGYTAIVSFFILLYATSGLLKAKKKLSLLFLTPIILPLLIILGYSLIRRSIYVNRYLIFITTYQIMAISLGIFTIKNKALRYISIASWLVFVIGFNIKITPFLKKTDFKMTFREINSIATSTDYVYAKTPIGFLESAYYFQNSERVFIYNPKKISIPFYIGINAVFENPSKGAFPQPPSRTFLVSDDGSFETIINR